MSFKVIEFGASQEPVCDFLLVINSNLRPISHRYWNTVTYWPKIANFVYPSVIWCFRSWWPPSNLWKSFMVLEFSRQPTVTIW